MFSTISHYRLATTRQLTAFELRALLQRHANCTAGQGHTPLNCSALTQLLQIRADQPHPSNPDP